MSTNVRAVTFFDDAADDFSVDCCVEEALALVTDDFALFGSPALGFGVTEGLVNTVDAGLALVEVDSFAAVVVGFDAWSLCA